MRSAGGLADNRVGPMKTLVDFVIPTHRRPALLAEAVASALAQGDLVGAVIVVNDGEPLPPGTLPADPRLRVLSNRRRPGAPGARNTGLEEVRAPWVVFLDDDDLLDADFVPVIAEAVRKDADDRTVVYGTGFRIRDAMGRVREVCPKSGPVGLEEVLVHNALGPTSFAFVKAETVRTVGGFDERLDAAQDWDLWIRLVETGTVRRIAACLGTYRVHREEQISAADPTVRYVRYLPFFRKRARHPLSGKVRRSWAAEAYWWGVLMAWTGNVRGSSAAFARALADHPGHLRSRLMRCLVRTPFRRCVLRALYGWRADRMRFEDRGEPLPFR